MFAALLAGTARRSPRRRWPSWRSTRGSSPATLTLTWVVVAFVVSALVYWGATYVQTYLVGWVGQRVLQDLRIQLAHLQLLSVGFYSRRQARAGLTPDQRRQALDQLVSDGVATLFGSTLMLIGTVVILILLDLELALLTFLVFPVLALGSLAFRIVSANAHRHAREGRGHHRVPAGDTVGHPRRAHLRPGAATPRALRRAQRGQLRREHEDRLPQCVVLPGGRAAVGFRDRGILLYGGMQTINGEVTIGVLVAFIAALNNFFDPIQSLSQFYTTYQAGWRSTRSSSCSTRSPSCATARRRRARPDPRRDRLRARDVLLRLRGDALTTSTCMSRPARRSRWWAPRSRQVDLRQARRRFYDPTEGA